MAEKAGGRFDAVFLAVGAHLSKRQDIPARDAGKVYDALQFLKAVEAGRDAADRPPRRGLRRRQHGDGCGAHGGATRGDEALIIYRRTREQMPAHEFEADDAIEEGVKIHWLRTIKQIDGTTLHRRGDDARRERLSAAHRRIRDARGRLADPRARPGHRHRVPEERSRHRVQEGRHRRRRAATCGPAARACSPAATWCRSIARSPRPSVMARRRRGTSTPGSRSTALSRPAKHEVATFEMLRLWYHAEAKKRGQSTIDIERRRQTFDEVVGGLDADAARYEAQRCLSCGNCFECDGCFSACPEKAVIKLGPGKRLRVRLRQVHRLRDLLRPVPVRRNHDDRRSRCRGGRGSRARSGDSVRRDGDEGTKANMARQGEDARRQRGCGLDRVPGRTRSARSTRSRPRRRWASWRTSGRRRAGRTSGAPCRTSSRCRARAAPPAPCTARCRRAR